MKYTDEIDESISNTAEVIAEQSSIHDSNNTTQLDDYDLLLDSSEAIETANDCLENAESNAKQSSIVLDEELAETAHSIDDTYQRLPYQHNQSIERMESASAEMSNMSLVADANESGPMELATPADTVLDEHSNGKHAC